MQTHSRADAYLMPTLDLDQMTTAAAVLFGCCYRSTVRYGQTVLTDDYEGNADIHLGWHNGGYFVAHHAPGLPMNEELHSQFVEVVRGMERRAAQMLPLTTFESWLLVVGIALVLVGAGALARLLDEGMAYTERNRKGE